jgi:hypothetical protein
MPVIQLLRRQRSGGSWFKDNPGKLSSMRPYLKKPFPKIGLIEWLKIKALSSSPNTSRKKKNV